MVKSSDFSSFSSSSSSLDDHQSKRKRRDRKEKDGGELEKGGGLEEKRHRRRHDDDHRTKKTPSKKNLVRTMPLPAALSDYDELCANFRFVLPDDDEINYNDNTAATTANCNNRKKYGATWQERMVKNYHQGLYKEYVLADLSRVLDIGKIGLRWRTESEVSNGRGFRCCGNLTCQGVSNTAGGSKGADRPEDRSDNGGGSAKKCDAVIMMQQQQEAYKTAARRHVGIGVPENGGKEPMGMFLPPPPLPPAINATGEVIIDPLDQYLRSCHDDAVGTRGRAEERGVDDSVDDKKEDYERRSSKHNRQNISHSRRRRRSEGHSDDDDDGNIYRRRRRHDDPSSLADEQERDERTRISNVRHGIGLHDYEVDFGYVECGVQKRELVKVRLCLRCAPLLFVARTNSNSISSGVVVAPAMKARLAREDAAMRHHAMLVAGD